MKRSEQWAAPRSWLYVPGHSERKLRKAAELETDAVILDLEDAVPPDEKADGRAITSNLLDSLTFRAGQVWVRINSPSSPVDWEADIEAVLGEQLAGLVIPKASDPEDVRAVDAVLERAGAESVLLAPIVTENAAGYFAMPRTLVASNRVVAGFWGSEDLAADLQLVGPRDEDGNLNDTVRFVRAGFLLAARAYGVAAVDTPWLALDDPGGLRLEARRSFRGGFAGMQAIHPDQLPLIETAFAPSATELETAREVLRDAADARGGATRSGGQMIDAPHIRSAQRIVELAERSTLT